MSVVFPDVGEKHVLNWAFGDTTTPEDLTLKLYSNDYTPVSTSVAGNFTEATFTGYAAKSLTRASWSDSSSEASGRAYITYAEQSWDATSTETIYGYYIVGATSGDIICAEKFDGERILNSGDNLAIIPKLTGKSEN